MKHIISPTNLKIFCSVIAVLVVASMPTLQAFAETTQPNKWYPLNGAPYNDPNDRNSTDACAPVDESSPGGSDREATAYTFFRSKGFTPEQSAGFVGNFVVESNVDPAKKQGGGGPGRGIAQWEMGGRWDTIRWNNAPAHLVWFAADTQGEELSLNTQLNFVWWELNNSESGAFTAIKAQRSVADATRTVMDRYERPGTKHEDRRLAEANRIFNKLGKGDTSTPSPTPDDVSAGDCTSGDGSGGVGSINGFTFPLITTQKAITTNKESKWCYKNTSSCHHDYKAADIMITTGTPVIAAVGGKVGGVDNGSIAHLTVKGSDGRLYFYQHLGKGTIGVKDGQTVKAGDKLGAVGTRVDAMNTDPHLHFDILPSQYSSRPACKGPACSRLPFIDPQSNLVETFKALPKE